MEDSPNPFERPESDGPGEDDDALAAWLTSLPPCPGIPSTPEEIAASEARAEADIAAGRVYPHTVVGEWLKTWGTPDRRPFKEWLAQMHG